jgi:hypothetical protein
MPETLMPIPTTPRQTDILVVLLAPEILGDSGLEALRDTVSPGSQKIRLLLRLTKPADQTLVARLAAFHLPVQILLAYGISLPEGIVDVAQMPPGTNETDLNNLALALSDGVVCDPKLGETSELVLRAKDLGKPTFSPGQALPDGPAIRANLTRELDQILPNAFWRGIFGTLEQWILELLACSWSGKEANGSVDIKGKLKRVFLEPWSPGAYFAPPDWTNKNPDKTAVDGSVPIVARFEALDRSALRGSYAPRSDLVRTPRRSICRIFCCNWYDQPHHSRDQLLSPIFCCHWDVLPQNFRDHPLSKRNFRAHRIIASFCHLLPYIPVAANAAARPLDRLPLRR